MSKIKTLFYLIKNKRELILPSAFSYFARSKVSHLLPDKLYLKLQYRVNVGKRLNLKEPHTFNEKLQWLKLYNRNPMYTEMVDKYAVRDFVSKKIGEEYLVPLIGAWDDPNDINFESLPRQFVLKCNHDSGSVIICKNKDEFNKTYAVKKLGKKLKRDMFYWSREWPYKNIKRKIICEKFMKDREFDVLNVFKILNFNNGEQIIQVIQDDKMPNESIDYFDSQWNRLDMRQNFPNSKNPLPKPKTLDKMLDLAQRLSAGFPFLRTDFYEINGKVYFSEFTFFSDAGMCRFTPKEWDDELGNRIDITKLNESK